MTLEREEDLDAVLRDWGEVLQWRATPQSAPRDIDALVDRSPPGPIAGAPEGVAYDVEIVTRNNPARGVSSAELDEGTNEVLVAPRLGGLAKWLSVRLLSNDERAMRLGLTGG